MRALATFLLLSLAIPLALVADPAAAADCGSLNEPGCCFSSSSPCDPGLTQVGSCGFGVAGLCVQAAPCGGPGQRACCNSDGEPDCIAGYGPVDGCEGACLCGGETNPLGRVSQSRCVEITPCGGDGERACCIPSETLTNPCPKLTQSDAEIHLNCSGNCTCRGAGESIATCVRRSSLGVSVDDEPEAGWLEPESPRECPLSGYSDMHVHLHNNRGSGGRVFAGEPAPWNGQAGRFTLDNDHFFATALNPGKDREIHALVPDAELPEHFGDLTGLGTTDGSIGFSGAPLFSDWPTWTTTTHQQIYYPWLERAYRGGLRLMVMLAVTNEALCKGRERYDEDSCADPMAFVDEQLELAYVFEDFIDELNGGEGLGWFRIVTSPIEARREIARGNMAVVLGIEVANLFNCKEGGPCPNMEGSDIRTLEEAVERYYEFGVRHIFPIHNFDNEFGGAATWNGTINLGNAISEGRWWEVEDCGPEGYGHWLDREAADTLRTVVNGLIFVQQANVPLIPPVPNYVDGSEAGFTDYASCNERGLTDTGKELIRILMARGILIDVDHVSRKSFRQIADMAMDESPHAHPYPLVASHVLSMGVHEKELEGSVGIHERMRTPEQLESIRETGGMVAAMLKDELQDTGSAGKKLNHPYPANTGPVIADDCRHSSKTFGQAYQYAVDVMDGPVAFGSDFNGIAGHVGPRFGHDACGGNDAERLAQNAANIRVEYPITDFPRPGFGSFEAQVSGLREFDYNVDGLAHIGLLPDMIVDLERVGLGSHYMDALFASAEAYIEVWERAEGEPFSVPEARCIADNVRFQADASCQADVSISANSLPSGNGLIVTESPGGPYPLGATQATLMVESELTCSEDRTTSCNATVLVVDEAPPSVTCPAHLTVECRGLETPVTFADPIVADNCDDTPTFEGCFPASGSGFAQGARTVACTAIDDGAARGDCAFDVVVQDTVAPSISAPADLLAVECTSSMPPGAAPALGAPDVAEECDPTPTVAHDAPGLFPLGSTTVTWIASDASNGVDGDFQRVEVVDTTAAEIRCPASLTVECSEAGGTSAADAGIESFLASVSAADVCDAELSLSNNAPDFFALGTNTVIFKANDASGNVAGCEADGIVVDTTPAELHCPAPTAVECSATGGTPASDAGLQAFLAGAHAADVCDPSALLLNDAPDFFALGPNPVLFKVRDASDNTSSCRANGEVIDTTAAELRCPAPIVVECSAIGGSPPGDPEIQAFLSGASAADVCDASPSISNNAPPFFALGPNDVTFKARDASNNTTTCTADGVAVVDTSPAAIHCPAPIVVECSEAGGTAANDAEIQAFLAGASASDVCDASPAITDDAPDFFALGPTPVTFDATDASGNSASCSKGVDVVDTIPPVIGKLTPKPRELWSPNHKMQRVRVGIEASDVCDPDIEDRCKVVAVASNEPDKGLDKDDVPSDYEIVNDRTVKLRSERLGGGSGRIYSITVECVDASGGNATQQVVTVTVPHDQG